MNPRLFNRFATPQDGWFHFVPKGEFTWVNPADPSDALIQVIDDESIGALKENMPQEMLIDEDHFSSDRSKPTTAMGWAHGPESGEIRPDGLYVKPKLSEAGLKNIAGGNLRYVSPVFDFDSAVFLGVDVRSGLPRYRVTRMTEAALTNKPNLKGLRPLSNRGHDAPGGEPGLGTPAEAATKEKNQTMKLINRALDLSPDASEEAAAAGIDKLKKERAEAGSALANREGELAEAKKELANRDSRIVELEKSIATAREVAVEAELTACGITDPVERKTFGGMLLANRETGKAALDAVVAARKEASDAKAAAAKPLTNRETAKTPEGQTKEVTGLARTQAAFAQAHNKQEEK